MLGIVADPAIVEGLQSGNEKQQALGCYCLHSLGHRRLAIDLDWWMQRGRRRFAILCIWCPFDLGFFLRVRAGTLFSLPNDFPEGSCCFRQFPGKAGLCRSGFLSAIPRYFLVSRCLAWRMGEFCRSSVIVSLDCLAKTTLLLRETGGFVHTPSQKRDQG